MDRCDVYDALNDLSDELLAIAYEMRAIADQAEAEEGRDPAPLDRGKVIAFDSISRRLMTCAATARDAERSIEGAQPAGVTMDVYAAEGGGGR